MCVVLLAHLRLRAVVVGVIECPCGTVFVECRIQWAVGGEGGELPVAVQSDGGSDTLQISIGRAGRVRSECCFGVSQGLECGEFSQIEATVHDETHTLLHPVHPSTEILQTSNVLKLEVIRIMVIAPAVPAGEERFASVFCSCHTEFDPFAVV